MDKVKEAIEAAFEEGARDYTELEHRANAYLVREGEAPATQPVIMRALKAVDPVAWELSK
jgi:hypothetical protein